MKLRGVLDNSLGNFLCIRGFAKMGDLYQISEPDESFQRIIDPEHLKGLVNFLNGGEYIFFPEVILGTSLISDENIFDQFDQAHMLRERFSSNQRFRLDFKNFIVENSIYKIKHEQDVRVQQYFHRVTLTIKDDLIKSGEFNKFSRIDGNHRLSAEPKKPKFENYNTPFCLVLYRHQEEAKRFSRVLFHNINFKAKPLSMEQNLRLILDDKELFPDEKLKTDPSFGWPYYLARKLYSNIDYDVTPDINKALYQKERTFLVEELSWLIQVKILGENESAIRRFKQVIAAINTLYSKYQQLSGSKNRGLLGAFVYYQLQPEKLVNSFAEWVIDNHIHTIEKSHSKDLVKVFDSILESRKRTIFVAMPFEKDKTENHYEMIKRVVEEINTEYNLRIKIKVDRIDGIVKGKSYEINNEILKLISNCGLLIGDLTYCNPNVYHEIGFLMGKARALGEGFGEMLLFLDESVRKDDRFVGFNLKGIKQLRFTRLNNFAQQLKRHLVKFFELKQIV